jgi:uncharacterized protein (TIGR03437 family)
MIKNCLFASSLALLSCVLSVAQNPVPVNILPSRIVGHLPENLPLPNANPNLVEGRELFNPLGIAVDTSVTPNILYVGDNGNQRILAWKNAQSFRSGAAADLVIGQPDFVHTQAQGNGTNSGFSDPSGLAVDSNGNLYVADRGNNRILRFPKPFAQTNGQFPDMVIGQPNLSTRTANYTGAVSDQGLSLVASPWPSNMAFDADKNLYVTDGGNRRVLRFSATDLASGTNAPHANLVLGSTDFTTVATSVTSATRTTANVFAGAPFAMAIDSAGRLFVSDQSTDGTVGRVLIFTPPFNNNQSAARMLGVFTLNLSAEPPQDTKDKTLLLGVSSIFFPGGKVAVVDAFHHRILTYDAYDQWPSAAFTFSPLATAEFGQPDFHNAGINGTKNTWAVAPTASSFSGPLGAVLAGSDLYVVDTGNNRVLDLPVNGSTISPATRVLGQDFFTTSAVNLIEGREFDFTSSTGSGVIAEGGMALDESGDTPHLYVADTFNHRVLGFKDFRRVQGGSKADIVIGQPDFSSNLCNVSGNPDAPTNASLCRPMGVAVDANGDLYVADTANGRVLRFPAPFSHQAQQADLVLGQRNFTSKITDASASTMAGPYGLAVSAQNGLFVSDVALNRVLYFPFTGNGTFTANDNGRAATKVYGQSDQPGSGAFTSGAAGTSDANLNLPRHISIDNEARLYVADTGNSRVVIYDQVNSTPNSGAHAAVIIPGLNQPRGVFANPATSEIWIAEGGSAVLKRYPRFSTLIQTSPIAAPNCSVVGTGNCVQAGSFALAVTQDKFGDLIVADLSSRVQFYYPGAQGFNGGHFLTSKPNLAPGLLTALCSPNSGCDPDVRTSLFGSNTAAAQSYPLPVSLGDVEVWFGPLGGELKRSPLYFASPSQINFVVPMDAPQSGTADIQVVQPSTGRILAAGIAPMATVAPGILEREYTGKTRQAAALNVEDNNTVNDAAHPARRGTYVSVYATGQGFVPGAPADGQPISGIIPTPQVTRVFLNGCSLDDSCVQNTGDLPRTRWLQYSGLSPYPGVWQINFYVPSSVIPGAGGAVSVIVSAGSSVTSGDPAFTMVIYVK